MKPHKHAELIKAWADGAEIEIELLIGKELKPKWYDDDFPAWHEDRRYRIKPEPKPDVCRYARAELNDFDWYITDDKTYADNLKIIFDGETGELKSAEVLK